MCGGCIKPAAISPPMKKIAKGYYLPAKSRVTPIPVRRKSHTQIHSNIIPTRPANQDNRE